MYGYEDDKNAKETFDEAEFSGQLKSNLSYFPTSTAELLSFTPDKQLLILKRLSQDIPNIDDRINFLMKSGFISNIETQEGVKIDFTARSLERGHIVFFLHAPKLHAARFGKFLGRVEADNNLIVVEPSKLGFYKNKTDLINGIAQTYRDNPMHEAFDAKPDTIRRIIDAYANTDVSKPEVVIGMVLQPPRPENGTLFEIVSLTNLSEVTKVDINEIVSCAVIGIVEEAFSLRQLEEIKHHDECRVFLKGYWKTGVVVGFGIAPGQVEISVEDGKTYTVHPETPIVDFRNPNEFDALPPLYEPKEHIEPDEMYTYRDSAGVLHLLEVRRIESDQKDTTNTRWITFNDTSQNDDTKKYCYAAYEFLAFDDLKKISNADEILQTKGTPEVFSVWSSTDSEYILFLKVFEHADKGLIYGKTLRVRNSNFGEIATFNKKDVYFHQDISKFVSYIQDYFGPDSYGEDNSTLVEFTVDGVSYEGKFDTLYTLTEYLTVIECETKARYQINLKQLNAFKKANIRLEKEDYLPLFV